MNNQPPFPDGSHPSGGGGMPFNPNASHEPPILTPEAIQNLISQLHRNQNPPRPTTMPAIPSIYPDPTMLLPHQDPQQTYTSAFFQQLMNQSNAMNLMPTHPPFLASQTITTEPARARQSRSEGTKAVTNNTSYASRHQQAEARRRSRINERLDALRRIIPHTERANTAVFLEDVVRYVQRLQSRVFELETKLGLPATVSPPTAIIPFGDGGQRSPDVTAGTFPTSMTATAALPQTIGTIGGGANLNTTSAANNTMMNNEQFVHAILQSAALIAKQTQSKNPLASSAAAAHPIKDKDTTTVRTIQNPGHHVSHHPNVSISEELAMAAQLASQKEENAPAIAESEPYFDNKEMRKRGKDEKDEENEEEVGEGQKKRRVE